tara:strand:- start:878 stop:1360 length:483 start_codon:yes stop_codon:yes gene_type:complete
MKMCTKCGESKELSEFHKNKYTADGHSYECKPCSSVRGKERYRKNSKKEKEQQTKRRHENKEKDMLLNAKSRAKRKGFPFDIEESDIIIPKICPVLGINIITNTIRKPTDNSPSLDKFIPELGYVKGNIAVISVRANRIKNNSTRQEIELLLQWMLKQEA